MNKLKYISLILLAGCSTVQPSLETTHSAQQQRLHHQANSTASGYQFAHDLDVESASTKRTASAAKTVIQCTKVQKSALDEDISMQSPSAVKASISHHFSLQHYHMATPFAQSDTKLTEAMRSELNFFFQKVNQMSSPYHLFILGHTNSDGTLNLNNKLSDERAQQALQYLARLGIEREVMTSLGMADRLPITTWEKGAHDNNRRVEILIYRPSSTAPTTEHQCYENLL